MGNASGFNCDYLYPKGYIKKAKKHAEKIYRIIKEKKGAWKDDK